MENKDISKLQSASLKNRFKGKTGVFVSQAIKNFAKFANKDISLFPKKSSPFSFKVYHAAGALIVLLFFVAIASFLIPAKINQKLLIKSVSIKQNSAIVAGETADWTVLIKKSDITKNNYLVKLPKSARGIKITTITPEEAQNILNKPTPQSYQALNIKQKKDLAIANEPSPFYAAGLLDGFSKFLMSDLGDAATQVIQDATNPDVQTTSDATVVNLSSDVSTTPAPVTPATCTVDSDCSSGQTCVSSVCTTPATTTPTTTPATCTVDSDCSSGQTCVLTPICRQKVET